MRWGLAVAGLLCVFPGITARAEEPAHLVRLVLPTDNDALFHGGGADFYQYIERNFHGIISTPWQGGQYGFVRDPIETRSGIIYTRFHEGMDIRPLRRDAQGDPTDEVCAIADGVVVIRTPLRRVELRQIHRRRARVGRLSLLQSLRTSSFDRGANREK